MLNITAFSLIHLNEAAYKQLLLQCGMAPLAVKSRPYVDSHGHAIADSSAEVAREHQRPAEQTQTVVEFRVDSGKSTTLISALVNAGWEVLVDGKPVGNVETIVPLHSPLAASEGGIAPGPKIVLPLQ